MKKSFSVSLLEFEEDYSYQNNLKRISHFSLNLKNLTEVKYMCPYKNLTKLEKIIQPLPEQKNIVFLGKGDYHYLTYLFLKRIKENLCLIVIDNHFDKYKRKEGFITCDTWLNDVEELKNVKKVVFVHNEVKYKEKNGKIVKTNTDIKAIFEEIKKLPIYISIDKDILSENYLKTNWDQGTLSLHELLNFLKNLSHRNIIGIDICGEPDSINYYEYQKSEKINLNIIDIFTTTSIERNFYKIAK